MSNAAVLTDIRNMIDLAIGTPELCMVDFCMLHTVLHCLAQQLQVLDKPVELHGDAAAMMPTAGKDQGHTVAITEYIYETDATAPAAGQHTITEPSSMTLKPQRPSTQPPTLIVVERVKKDASRATGLDEKTPDRPAPSAKAREAAGQDGRGQKDRHETRVQKDRQETRVQKERHEGRGQKDESAKGEGTPGSPPASQMQRISSTDKLSLVTLSKFNVLEDAVQDLKDRVYGSMPKNEQILEEVRSQTNIKAITDMWTNLNVSSRLEAAETGLAKLSSLVEDLIREGDHAGPRNIGAYQAPPAQAFPGQAPPAQAFPDQAASGQAPPGQAPLAQAPSGQAPPGQAPPGQATPGQAPPAQAPYAQAPDTQAPPGQAPPSQATPGQAPPAQAPYAQAPDTQAPYAQAPITQAPPPWADFAQYTVDPLAQLGPPYPWDTMAAEMYDERLQLAEQLQRLRSDVDQLRKTFYTAMENMEQGLDPKEAASKIIAAAPPPPPPLPPVHITPPPPVTVPQPPPPQYPQVPQQYPQVPQQYPQAAATEDHRPGPATAQGRRTSGTTANMMDRLAQLERRIKECCDEVGKGKGVARDQLNNFQDQLDHLMHQISTLHSDFNALNISPDLAKDLEGVAKLYQAVQSMQDQLRQVNEVVCRLASEKDDRQHHLNALLEQIEILKTIKLDREDMAEAMAEKADLRLLARKVSLDQFEMACDDLSRGLDHALGKLNTQESLWQQVLDDVQREIESKLDKMELSPLKDFFNNKLRQLQENLKQMASLRRDVEAAGTTRRLLRDVNCVSCAAEAVMAMDNASATPSKPLPAHLSMKPYLSYELDAIRKTQASNLPQRNLHDWETIDKQMAPKPPVKARSEADRHICNRYCGGSHTTTTPAQRVARLGHFVKQWGPDVVPLSSHMAAGDDGRLYKVTSGEQAKVGPGGTAEPPCTKKPKSPETPKPPPPKSAISIRECRCLEAGD